MNGEKKSKGVLFYSKENGRWVEDGDENKDWKYVGEIENGEPHGQGKVTYPDGQKYIGEWKDGQKNGQGTLTFTNDVLKFSGEWLDDKLWNGTLTDKNGNILRKSVNGKWDKINPPKTNQ